MKRLDDDHLVVADGRNGLRVLERAAGSSAPWRVVGAAPLAGLSAFVTVVGSRAYVAALSGGAHVVELSRPASPERVGTVETGDIVYAAHPAGDLVVVANGATCWWPPRRRSPLAWRSWGGARAWERRWA
ncbi:MAG: hypothetical protein IPF99_32710 [Deltaproteobacteria bacterium]|nr:hypothetical protein [Deltaproteobacteria bacterium]